MTKKLVAINLKVQGGYYRIASVVKSNDGSVHIVTHINNFLRKKQKDMEPPLKFTLHKSGVNHFTLGAKPNQKEWLREQGEKIINISKTKGLMYLTILDPNKHRNQILDKLESVSGYKSAFTLDARDYKDLTLRFFLANKKFNFKEETKKYKEVFWVQSEGVDILVTASDEKVEVGQKIT